MSKEEYQYCYYCKCNISKNNLELDHFPIPQDCSGVLTVPACRSCHDMKDRFNLCNWDKSWYDIAVRQMGYLDREGKIMWAKLIQMGLRSDKRLRDIENES